jgi:hypothetical protein
VTESTLATFGWSEGIALSAAGLSVVISLVSLGFARRADRRADRADRRDEERIERERAEAEAANAARLMIWPTGSSLQEENRRFAFRIINHGKVTAHNVHVWLHDYETGQDVSVMPQAGFSLTPEEADEIHAVMVPQTIDPHGLRFAVRWEDASGHHKRIRLMSPAL